MSSLFQEESFQIYTPPLCVVLRRTQHIKFGALRRLSAKAKTAKEAANGDTRHNFSAEIGGDSFIYSCSHWLFYARKMSEVDSI